MSGVVVGLHVSVFLHLWSIRVASLVKKQLTETRMQSVCVAFFTEGLSEGPLMASRFHKREPCAYILDARKRLFCFQKGEITSRINRLACRDDSDLT